VAGVPLTLRNFTLRGTLQPDQANGAGDPPGTLDDGQFTAALKVDDLCVANLDVLGAACDGVSGTINLLDLIDGPRDPQNCGQDGSATGIPSGPPPCAASTDASSHYPADATVDVPNDAFNVAGTVKRRARGSSESRRPAAGRDAGWTRSPSGRWSYG
jgi:hypothetical protein